ncbi:MAG: hypothetical protein JO342_17625 [Solirubrobacterales bacterium]|nr:hypothetical protein [Solirubrobacterales bacterium]
MDKITRVPPRTIALSDFGQGDRHVGEWRPDIADPAHPQNLLTADREKTRTAITVRATA